MSDRERLAGYVAVWRGALAAFTAVLEELAPADWNRPTDLPGWDVRAVASHVAHLESVVAGFGDEDASIPSTAHLTALTGYYTEVGVLTRRTVPTADLIAEIRVKAARRHEQLLADPPLDGSARAPLTPGDLPWTWATLLRNRPLDVWMHEQDIRRATDRPGGMDSPGAEHTVTYFLEGLGFVVGKAVGAPPGTSVVLAVAGSPPVAVEVDPNRRAQRVTPPAAPTVRLTMDRETYICRAGGRRPAAPGAVTIEGDADLGERILTRLAVTT